MSVETLIKIQEYTILNAIGNPDVTEDDRNEDKKENQRQITLLYYMLSFFTILGIICIGASIYGIFLTHESMVSAITNDENIPYKVILFVSMNICLIISFITVVYGIYNLFFISRQKMKMV